jgi:hypothetical protein
VLTDDEFWELFETTLEGHRSGEISSDAAMGIIRDALKES